VYRAHDSKLGRAVALKILPHDFAADADRRARFEREAKLLASLNHPHIGAIYGYEDRDGVYGLVLELIEGQTLSDRLRLGPIPMAQAIGFARQIADALAAAHARGIVHRDLKPANIMLTRDGTVKLLDFGLAKARLAVPDAETTGVGMVLGTAAYMSPEQARGEETDARTDIWAFGCVMSEMLTGHKVFAGATASDTIAAILASEPDWAGLPSSTPDEVRRLLQRCLEKDRDRRLHDIADARLELDEWRRDDASGAPARLRVQRARVAVIAATIVAIAAIATAVWMLQRTKGPARTTRLSISTPGFISPQLSGIVSPDGQRVAFVSTARSGKLMLWIRALDDLEARMVLGSEDAAHPFWSPNGRQIGFQADGHVKIADPAGAGAVRVLTDSPIRSGAAWSKNDVILFARSDGLAMIPASGGTPSVVIASDRNECQPAWPTFLPDGTHFLFFCRGPEDRRGVYVGSIETREKKRLLAGALRPAYASGHLFTVRGETLMAYPFDPDRLQTTGDPVPVADGIWNAPGAGQASYSISNDGVLAYVNAAVSKAQFSWFDRAGQLQGRIGERDRSFATPQLSPDARRLVIAQGPTSAAEHVWLMDATGTRASRLTFGNRREYNPVWSPNAMRLAYLSNESRVTKIMLKNADGSGGEQELYASDRLVSIDAWSPDGRYVVFTATGPRSLSDIWLLPLAGNRRATPFLESAFNKTQAQVSPDSRWIAYTSYESGGDEIYVQSFPVAGNKKQVSVGGGVQPRWRRDGKELFFLSTDGRLMATPVKSGTTLTFGEAKPLFKTAVIPHGSQSIGLVTYYDVSPDGQRFLCVIPSASDESFAPITVVLNWQAALKPH
jgi:Tol biopolymer transport system component/tRNA A-37 threonylcarbamoyl transferase component Bud32